MTLRDALLEAGGVTDDPAAPPAHFGNPAAEYKAARTSAALFWLDDLAWLQLEGSDRAKFLHNFCTADIKQLAPGRTCEAFACNVKGRILAQLLVAATPDALLVGTSADRLEFLHSHLDRYLITEDVQFTLFAEPRQTLYLCGPDAQAPDGGFPWDGWNVPGWILPLIHEPPDGAADRYRQLVAAGARPAGTLAAEALRIEAVLPRYGVDISDDHLAQEANRTPQAISFTKGCYLGQEPIARIDALGHVNRELVGLRFADPAPVPPGTPVLNPADNTPAGTITSSATIPGGSVALAVLKAALTADGTSVLARVGGGSDRPGTVFRPPA